MDKKTLNTLFAEALYRIPDYQRGYAWEEKQWKDFIQDVDALVDDEVTGHYTGTVVVYAGSDAPVQDYGTKRLKVLDVVDGQQRLTTCCLYLSVIIRALIDRGENAYEREIPDFLYCGAICKLALNNDAASVFYDLLKTGHPYSPPQSVHEKRLIAAYERLQQHVDTQLAERDDGVVYLKELYHAITQKLHFTFYAIEEECEIGMTFELMNPRGKGLSVLELLKNYFMHWISRNVSDPRERTTMTTLVNKNWRDTYANLGSCGGDEDQCLRIAWTLYCTHSPGNWIGYDGFKADEYVPLRTFTKRSKEATRDFMMQFADRLADISGYYAAIVAPSEDNALSKDELAWLIKIHHTGNIANFLPLLVAARKHRLAGSVSEKDHLALLKALECYAYRVFLFEGRRSDAGKSNFYRWGFEVFAQTRAIPEVVAGVYELARYYAPEELFAAKTATPRDWYSSRLRLKYTLFEYELHLLATEGQGKEPLLTWKQLNDSTIEHILPQTPDEDSRWSQVWSTEDFKTSVHDIGNLVLTQDNSSYRNFEFSRKKGAPGQSPSYCNSDIRQERKISAFSDWTPAEFGQRRAELAAWILDRWKTEGVQPPEPLEVVDEADVDGVTLELEAAVA